MSESNTLREKPDHHKPDISTGHHSEPVIPLAAFNWSERRRIG